MPTTTTPAASPTVSSTIGLKNMVIAPLTADTEDTLVLPPVSESVHPGRPSGRLSRGSPDARHRLRAHGRPDTDHQHTGLFPYEGSDAGDSDSAGAGRDSPPLTLPEFIYSTYNSLLENGWKMHEIDNMDMLGYFRIRSWKAQHEKEKKAPRHRYIDEVWSNLKP